MMELDWLPFTLIVWLTLMELMVCQQYQQQQHQQGIGMQHAGQVPQGMHPQQAMHPQQGMGHPQQFQQAGFQQPMGQPMQHQHMGPPVGGGGGQQMQQNVLHDKSRIQDKEHIKEHLGGVISEPDLGKMSEEELQFHYFKMHDNDNNNKLDGSELIKSLIHWHVEESKHMGANAPPHGTTKIFTDQELAQMIDPILDMDDKNRDGFIDYAEFIAAQKTRGF